MSELEKRLKQRTEECNKWMACADNLYKALSEAGTRCSQMHHSTKDQGHGYVCPVEARVTQALEQYRDLKQ